MAQEPTVAINNLPSNSQAASNPYDLTGTKYPKSGSVTVFVGTQQYPAALVDPNTGIWGPVSIGGSSGPYLVQAISGALSDSRSGITFPSHIPPVKDRSEDREARSRDAEGATPATERRQEEPSPSMGAKRPKTEAATTPADKSDDEKQAGKKGKKGKKRSK